MAPRAFLFFGVFTGYPELLQATREAIVAQFGSLHECGVSPVYPFPSTQAYDKTMGTQLHRQFFVLNELQPQTCLAVTKHAALQIEKQLSLSSDFAVERPLNIDPGLLNDCRLILASTKDYAHRFYRGDNIWEEITLIYRGGAFEPLPWTYPDFRAPTYHEFFVTLRKDLLKKTRNG